MELFSLIYQNLVSPHLLFFALGIAAGLLKSDLVIPEQIGRFLAIYLVLAIGFQGGVMVATTPQCDLKMVATLVTGCVIGFLQPFWGYALLKKTTQLDTPTAAATAAHYGSISMVTFVAACNFLSMKAIPYAGYIVAVIALMEAPAVISGLCIAHRAMPTLQQPLAQQKLYRHITTNGTVLLLLGSFFIGFVTGPRSMQKLEGFLVAPFQGILLLFLLDMGLLVAQHIADLKHFSRGLLLFGIYMPLLHAVLGIGMSRLIGLEQGTGFLFTVLISSASYIVVTAAMRSALPQAKVAIYLPMSLAVTFPFNIALGIPWYFMLAEKFLHAS